MTWLLNLAPFRWWRARRMPPLVVHGPKTRWASLASRLAPDVPREIILGRRKEGA